jgi:hypothetical protein
VKEKNGIYRFAETSKWRGEKKANQQQSDEVSKIIKYLIDAIYKKEIYTLSQR